MMCVCVCVSVIFFSDLAINVRFTNWLGEIRIVYSKWGSVKKKEGGKENRNSKH